MRVAYTARVVLRRYEVGNDEATFHPAGPSREIFPEPNSRRLSRDLPVGLRRVANFRRVDGDFALILF